MKRILLFLMAILTGAAGGLYAGAGWQDAGEATPEAALPAPPADGLEYVKMNNQFIIPVLSNGRVASLVVLSLSLEMAPGQSDRVYAREPRLRDAFLQVMFDHANTGGFTGSFTDSGPLLQLRNGLLETARQVLGPGVTGVMITEIARQDS